VRLAYRLDGPPDLPVLVLSPSLGTTTDLWESVLPGLAARCRVLRHDLPGHGASPVPDGPVRIEDIARGVLALLDELVIERASFCGLSIGGMVGQWLGANASERIDGLALCCTGAKLGSREDFLARAELVRREGTGVTVEGARERWFTPACRDAAAARRILVQLAEIPAEGYAACAEAVGEWDFRDQLNRVAPGALLLFGEEDPVTPPEVRETLIQGIREAQVAVVAGAAHLANVEQPEAFTAAVLAYLEERSP
jgi:3-oxoadipate enol-lactonase